MRGNQQLKKFINQNKNLHLSLTDFACIIFHYKTIFRKHIEKRGCGIPSLVVLLVDEFEFEVH